MIQVTAMNSAKPAASGMEVLAGMPGETQDSGGFEGALTTQMESAAPAAQSAADALRQAGKMLAGKLAGKATGKPSGKILPLALPEGQDLPSGKGKSVSAGLPVLPEDAAAPIAETDAETVVDPSSQLASNPVAMVMLPLPLPVTAQAAAAKASALGEGQPQSASRDSLLPPAVTKAASPVPAALLPQLPAADKVAVPAVTGQEAKAAQPAAVRVLATPLGNVSIHLGQEAGVAGQVPLPVQALQGRGLPDQALPDQSMPARVMAANPLVMSGEAIRLRTVVAKAGHPIPETPVAEPIEAAASASVSAEDATPLLPTSPGEEAVPATTSRPARQTARFAGISSKEGLDRPRQLAGLVEARQDAQGWFGPSVNARADAAMPAGQIAQGHMAERPHDFAALVDRLVAAREFAMPAPVHAAINHAEFGEVSLKFEHGDHGLSVAVSSADPDFARAVQAAAPSAGHSAMQDNHDSGAAGNSAAHRQDALAQSFGSGAQSQSRNADGGDRQGGEVRQFRREAPASSRTETDQPRQDGIFA